MLFFLKVFGKKRSNKPVSETSSSGLFAKRSRALKIVHAGGRTESYYMAVPADAIIEKNPSSYLTRPDVFKRPWASVVRPDEILLPGQKFYVVPRRTVNKLRVRTSGPGYSFESQYSVESIGPSKSGILVRPGSRTAKDTPKSVRFLDLEMAKLAQSNIINSIDMKKMVSDGNINSKKKRI